MSCLTGTDCWDAHLTKFVMKLWTPNFNFMDYLEEFDKQPTAALKVDCVYADLQKHKLLPEIQIVDGQDISELRPQNSELFSNVADVSGLSAEYYDSLVFPLFADILEKRNQKYIEDRIAEDAQFEAMSQARAKGKTRREPIPEIPGDEKHPNIQNASKNIDIVRDDSELGTHIIAARNIHPGELLAVEKPYVSARTQKKFYLENFDSRCLHCLQTLYETATACKNCDQAIYCGKECKLQAFEEYHKYECGIFKKLTTVISAEVIEHYLIALRTAFKERDHSEDVPSNSNFYGAGFKEVSELKNCFNYTILTNQFCVAMNIAKIFHLVKTRTSFFSESPATRSEDQFKEILFKMVLISSLKSLTIRIAEKQTRQRKENMVLVGYGLYPLTSLLSYSCTSNVKFEFCAGNTLVLKATRMIKQGEKCIKSIHDMALDEVAVPSFFNRKEMFRQVQEICCCQNSEQSNQDQEPSLSSMFALLQLLQGPSSI